MNKPEQPQKPYYYMDNWYGHMHRFQTFLEAKEAAKSETGTTIAIYLITGELVKIVPASGYTPA